MYYKVFLYTIKMQYFIANVFSFSNLSISATIRDIFHKNQ